MQYPDNLLLYAQRYHSRHLFTNNYYFCYCLPLDALHLNKLKPLQPRMLCAKFSWYWPSGSGEEDENVKSLQTDGGWTKSDQKSSLGLSAQVSWNGMGKIVLNFTKWQNSFYWTKQYVNWGHFENRVFASLTLNEHHLYIQVDSLKSSVMCLVFNVKLKMQLI